MDKPLRTFSHSLHSSLLRGMLLIFFVGSSVFLSAHNNARGFLVTKNGMKLTGIISQVFGGNEIIFINDFGTPYKIHAALVYGFVVPAQGKSIFYASKFNGKNWRFMRLLHQGEGMNLYSAPISRLLPPKAGQFGLIRPEVSLSNAYFVELKGRLPVEISRSNFKKSMRRLLKKEAPELSQLIGKKGYRFKNLEEIIELYNKVVQKKLISM